MDACKGNRRTVAAGMALVVAGSAASVVAVVVGCYS